MPAQTLESKLKHDLQHIEIGAKLMARGDETRPLARLLWIREVLDDAIEIQRRIEKRDKRKAVAS